MSGTIGWRAANRLLNGRDGGQGTENLRMLIELAAAPEPAEPVLVTRPGAVVVPAQRKHPIPDALIAAFRETAAVPQPPAVRTGGRRPSTSRSLALRFTAAVLVVCGGGAAAASAGVLPAGMQRMAHDYLGVGADPAPSTHGPSSNAVTGRLPGGDRRTSDTTAGALSTRALITLCRQIPANNGDGDSWRTHLSAADQATLIAAAGSDHKVEAYCDQLLHDENQGQGPGTGQGSGQDSGPNATPDSKASAHPSATPTPSPAPTAGLPSAAPYAKPTPTRGLSAASHTPTPRSSGTDVAQQE